jgi:cytochrome c peroxidase
MTQQQLEGMDLFYGKARCATCRAGALQTDHNFYAIGLPQIGPGKNSGAAYAVSGLGMVTGEEADMYRFRIPSLRNVAQTGPYGHNGAYAPLEDMVRHHLDPVRGLARCYRGMATLSDGLDADDRQVMEDFDEVMRIAEAIEIPDVNLDEVEIDRIMSFLKAVTDEGAGKRGLGVPTSVPSGLPVDRVAPPS